MYLFICFALTTYFVFKFVKYKCNTIQVCPERKAVVITGCSTGFGNLLAKRLDSMGYQVFATSRNPSDPNVLRLKEDCSPRLHLVQLDVRNEDSVKKAVQFVKDNLGSKELWCLVNNAGIFEGFAVEMTDMSIFNDVMNVNALGSVRVTKAFLPLLRRSRGRVVYLTSPLGRIPFPFFTPYIISKFALEGFLRCLRIELSMWGIPVIAVEPEHFRTPMAEPDLLRQALSKSVDTMDREIRKEFGEEFVSSYQKLVNLSECFSSSRLDVVINDLVSAVSSVHPRDTYPTRRSFLSGVFFFVISTMSISDKLWRKILAFFFCLIRFPSPADTKEK